MQIALWRPGACFPLSFCGPVQIAPEIRAALPRESPKDREIDFFGMQTPVGFHAPLEIGTAPGSEAVAAGEAPKYADHQLLPELRAEAFAAPPMPSGVA